MEIFYYTFVGSWWNELKKKILYILSAKSLYFLSLKLKLWFSHNYDSNRYQREGVLLLSLTSYYLTGYWLKEALERVLIRTAVKTALKSRIWHSNDQRKSMEIGIVEAIPLSFFKAYWSLQFISIVYVKYVFIVYCHLNKTGLLKWCWL